MRNHYHTKPLVKTLLGIGIGPSNLSLAALISKMKNLDACFFEQKNFFSWHSGLLLPDAKLQVSHLEDLVTTVDPTNPYSFVAFLAKKKRLYRFIYANFRKVLRSEFNEYLAWVSESLSGLYFSEKVETIDFAKHHFIVRTNKREMKATHLVLGAGIVPYVPPFALPHLGKTVLHSSTFLHQAINFTGKKVAVIGGGQSSAEIIQTLISDSTTLPAQLYWISRRGQFYQLDESPFIYELFSPNFANYFYKLTHFQKQQLLKKYTVANDGISGPTAETIYQKIYALELIDKRKNFFHSWPHHTLIDLKSKGVNWSLALKQQMTLQYRNIEVDIIIFCTGYERPVPAFMASLWDKIKLEQGHYIVNPDFSIVWDGPAENRIYIQNAARHSYGLADTSLCLTAWRSAKIINSIANTMVYDLDEESITIDWNTCAYKEGNDDSSLSKECGNSFR